MAKKRRKKKRIIEPKRNKYPILTSKLRKQIVIVIMFALAVIIFLSFFNIAGQGGRFLFDACDFVIGKTTFSIPLLLVLGALLFLKPQKKRIFAPVFGALILLLIGISGLFQVLILENRMGGALGYMASWPLLEFFGPLVSAIVFSVIIIVGLLIIWEFIPKRKPVEKKEKEEKKEVFIKKMPEFKPKKVEKIEKQEKPKEETVPVVIKGKYISPSLDLLSSIDQKPSTGDTEYAGQIIKKTLANFGISVEVQEINIGPTVTQYALKPAEGVKLSKIVGLNNDLALALAAHPIRIEAPIPSRSLVGIEVPNKVRANVALKDVMMQTKFMEQASPLMIPLGEDVSGNPMLANLDKMPHLLVAGSTGTGKTIFLQNLIVSLIFRNSPQILRLVLVDPKRVEFPIYGPIPHLLTPVIFEANKTVNLLTWLTHEMERRFEILRNVKCRDIASFNSLMSKNNKLRDEYGIMPYIVLIVDELADLMAAKGRDVEAAIVRLAQLSRAVGIHLVLATQRPSVDVITGLIKANLTTRVAFQVASQFDSRTILDMSGAENLLGKGDMLYLSAEFGKPKRIQGCYVEQKDVKKVIDFVSQKNDAVEKKDFEEKLAEQLERTSEVNLDMDVDDPLFEEAKRVVIEYKKASASLLQRRLKIGYARAARLIDILEEKNIVGPADGARPREVYIQEDLEQEL